MLRAIVQACKERGIATDHVTEFDEAERRLAEWEEAAKSKKGVREFYADFVKALAQVSPARRWPPFAPGSKPTIVP